MILNQLLHKQAQWDWTDKEQHTFEASKQLLLSSQTLAQFDSKLQILLACDTSAYGIRAVCHTDCLMAQKNQWNLYLHRTLSTVEKNILRKRRGRLHI